MAASAGFASAASSPSAIAAPSTRATAAFGSRGGAVSAPEGLEQPATSVPTRRETRVALRIPGSCPR